MDTKQEEVTYEMCITKRMALLIFNNWLAFLMHLLTASSLSSTGVFILASSDDGVYGWWVARDGSKMQYWGGAKPTDYQKCACGVTIPNSCADPKYGCNCDKNDGSWREDSGLLTENSHLPVTQLRFGDTGLVASKATIPWESSSALDEPFCQGFAPCRVIKESRSYKARLSCNWILSNELKKVE